MRPDALELDDGNLVGLRLHQIGKYQLAVLCKQERHRRAGGLVRKIR
jgi:hypothetical protein